MLSDLPLLGPYIARLIKYELKHIRPMHDQIFGTLGNILGLGLKMLDNDEAVPNKLVLTA